MSSTTITDRRRGRRARRGRSTVPQSIAAVVTAAIIAASCGGDDEAGDDDAEAAGVDDSEPAADRGTESDPEVIADSIGVDLSDCDDSVAEAIDGELKVGETGPMSGATAAAFGPTMGGLKAGLATKGEIDGHPIELLQQDDQYLPEKTVSATEEFIDSDEVSALVGTIGSPNILAIQDTVNLECLPLIGGFSGATAAFDLEEYPWVVPSYFPYVIETRIWVDHMSKEFPDGAKVALFYGNNDTGKDYADNVKRWLDGTNHELVGEETIEVTDSAAPTSQVTTLKASGADVLMSDPAGPQCTALLTAMANSGWRPVHYTTQNCTSATVLEPAGDAADGLYGTVWRKDPADPRWKDDAGMKAYLEAMEQHAADQPADAASPGYVGAEVFIEVAERAARSPLGLSRLGMLDAQRNLDFQPTMTLPGVKVALSGTDDMMPIESAMLARFDTKTKLFRDVELYRYEGEMTGAD